MDTSGNLDIAAIIKTLRQERGWKQQDLADRLGVSRPTVAQWETRKKPPGRKNLVKLAQIFGISVEALLGQDEKSDEILQLREDISQLTLRKKQLIDSLSRSFSELRPDMLRLLAQLEEELVEKKRQLHWIEAMTGSTLEQTRKVPLLGFVHAGHPQLAEEVQEGTIELPVSSQADFALRVHGDSMIGAGILDGDIAVCRRVEHQVPKPGDIVVTLIGSTEATLKILTQTPKGDLLLKAANPSYPDIPLNPLSDVIQGVVIEIKSDPKNCVSIAMGDTGKQS